MDFVSTVIQQPVGSGLGWATTAAEVLAGRDLTGRRILVTGGYAGIGRATTAALAGAGATVVVPARRPEAAAEALADVPGVEVGELDLADLGSVRVYVDDLLADGRPLHGIIANAGIMACPETRVGPDRWEAQLATNHVGHFALVTGVLPLLEDGSRVVCLTSLGHHYSPMRWDDPWFRTGYDKWLAYGQSKTAVMLFARGLAARGVPAYSVHPGAIITELGKYLTAEDLDELLVADADGNRLMPDFKSPEQGAATAVWGLVAEELSDRPGAYLEDCDVAGWAQAGRTATGAKPYALADAEAERLWSWTEELLTTSGASSGPR